MHVKVKRSEKKEKRINKGEEIYLEGDFECHAKRDLPGRRYLERNIVHDGVRGEQWDLYSIRKRPWVEDDVERRMGIRTTEGEKMKFSFFSSLRLLFARAKFNSVHTRERRKRRRIWDRQTHSARKRKVRGGGKTENANETFPRLCSSPTSSG